MKDSPQGYCFTFVHEGIVKSLITPAMVEAAANSSDAIEIEALWDTGASMSLISWEFAKRLNLEPISKIFISTPSAENIPSNVYLINLRLPNNTLISNISVVEGVLTGCNMLIGMDVISCGDFAVTNFSGRTVFSFRMPSLTTIDFGKHSYIQPFANYVKKVGRNDPCPCGSGKKYKTCCWK